MGTFVIGYEVHSVAYWRRYWKEREGAKVELGNNWAERMLERIHYAERPNKKPYKFYTSCVGSTEQLTQAMTNSFTKREVTYKTMASRCDLSAFKWALGYTLWANDTFPSLKNDCRVSYYKSMYDGNPCYYLVHSAIEYIWVRV